MIDNKIYASVAPRFVPHSNPLAHISDVYNGILVGANMLDKVLFYGKGAGKLPTASAVVADIMDIVEKMSNEHAPIISWENATDDDIADEDAYLTKWCIILDGQAPDGNDFNDIDSKAIITDKISYSACVALAKSTNSNYKIYPII